MRSSLTPRLIPLVMTALTLAPGILWSPAGRTPVVPELPADSLAVAFISDPRSDLSLLGDLRLKDLLEVDDSRMAAASASLVAEIGALFRQQSAHLWIAILDMEYRPVSDSWKPHFCLVLEPRPGQMEKLLRGVDRTAAALVGGEVEVTDGPHLRTFQGTPRERVLYRALSPGGVLISNSAPVLQQSLASLEGRQPGLTEDPHFKALAHRLLRPRGVFLYLKGDRLLPFLPHVGYHVEQGWLGPREEWLTIGSDLQRPSS